MRLAVRFARRRLPSRLRALTVLLASMAAGSCGGGGGGGGGGAVPTGDIEGTIVLPDATWSMIAEQEPNDTVAQAQVLPPIQPRSTVTVAGEVGIFGTRQGRTDTTDAFRIRCHDAQVVTLTLTASTDGVAVGNFDLAAFDTATSASLGASATLSNPEVVTFTLPAETPADVVVTCAVGDGAYVLRIATADPPPAMFTAGSLASVLYESSSVRAAELASNQRTAPSFDAAVYLMDAPECAPGRLLLRTLDAASARRLAARVGATVVRRTGGGSFVLEMACSARDLAAREALAAAATLQGDGEVETVEPDWIVRPLGEPDDASFQRQWNLAAIGCASAWDVTKGSASIVVGVIDTGIAAHPDLDTQRVPGFDFVSDPTYGADGDGRDTDPTDPGGHEQLDGTSEYHGTHVAGIVAARQGDQFGVSGVAPGCRIMPLRASGVTGGTISDLSDAIRYAAGLTVPGPAAPLAAPLRIINISLGTSLDSTELSSACQAAADAGVLIVAAAGNDGGPVLFPAAYTSAFAVGAVDGRLVHASYSNTGPSLECLAPGGKSDRDVAADGFGDGILSTVRDETRLPSTASHVYYGGTSMAVPHVAGVAALVLSVDPTLSLAALRTTLLSTCRDLGVAGFDDTNGFGLIQAGEAVRLALSNKGTPRTDPPSLALSSRAVRIPEGQTTATVYVNNAGGGTLTITSVVPSTDDGLPWLSGFRTAASPGDPSNTTLVIAAVDRTGLSTGFHAGSLLIRNGAVPLGVLRVVLEVGDSPLDGVSFSLTAIDDATGVVVKSGFAIPETGYRFALRGVPEGRYRLRAGTDLDRDGLFCEANDWCGQLGGAIPGTVQVIAGQVASAGDIVLSN